MPNLSHEFAGATIAHLTDLHCNPIASEDRIARCVEMVNALDVDFVVLTGDFITTGPRTYAKRAARVLKGMKARVAKLACLGNHDYNIWHPSGLGHCRRLADSLIDELAQADIDVLRNRSRLFFRGESVLQFVGVEDFWTPHFDPKTAMDMVDRDSPSIAMVHNPDGAPAMAACGAHWILSGHTHGQATPSTRFWDIVYPTRHKRFVAGEYALGRGRYVYVNRGVGNGVHIGRCSRPEITLFVLVPAAQGHNTHRSPSAMPEIGGLHHADGHDLVGCRLAGTGDPLDKQAVALAVADPSSCGVPDSDQRR